MTKRYGNLDSERDEFVMIKITKGFVTFVYDSGIIHLNIWIRGVAACTCYVDKSKQTDT